MATINLTTNSSTPWLIASGEGVHVGLHGDFGGGTATLEQRIGAATYPILNEGLAVSYTAADDFWLKVAPGDRFRVTLAGATAPALAVTANPARTDYDA